jgi:hypothetical protein
MLFVYLERPAAREQHKAAQEPVDQKRQNLSRFMTVPSAHILYLQLSLFSFD